MAIKMKTVVTQHAEASCPTHSRTDFRVRDITSVVDEPEVRGGTNQGPTPTETMVAALLGCTNVITHKIAHKHGIDLHGMELAIDSQFDRRGVTLEEEVDLPFPSMVMKVQLKGDVTAEQAEFLRVELQKYCAVGKMIRGAGTKIEEIWTVEEPATA